MIHFQDYLRKHALKYLLMLTIINEGCQTDTLQYPSQEVHAGEKDVLLTPGDDGNNKRPRIKSYIKLPTGEPAIGSEITISKGIEVNRETMIGADTVEQEVLDSNCNYRYVAVYQGDTAVDDSMHVYAPGALRIVTVP